MRCIDDIESVTVAEGLDDELGFADEPAPKPKRRRAPPQLVTLSFPTFLWDAPPFRALELAERCLVLELDARKQRLDNMFRRRRVAYDDVVTCSITEAANLLNASKSVAGRTMANIGEAGFVETVRPSNHHGIAAGYRLTWRPYRGEPATCDFVKIFDRKQREKDAARVRGIPFFSDRLAA